MSSCVLVISLWLFYNYQIDLEAIGYFNIYKIYFKEKNGWYVQRMHQRVGRAGTFQTALASSSSNQTLSSTARLGLIHQDLTSGRAHVGGRPMVSLWWIFFLLLFFFSHFSVIKDKSSFLFIFYIKFSYYFFNYYLFLSLSFF